MAFDLPSSEMAMDFQQRLDRFRRAPTQAAFRADPEILAIARSYGHSTPRTFDAIGEMNKAEIKLGTTRQIQMPKWRIVVVVVSIPWHR
jgi:hypothetical protein